MLDKPSGYQSPYRRLWQIRPFRHQPEGNTPDTGANVRASALTMLIAFALMALFNSSEFRSFTRDLPGNWLTDQLVMYSDQWHELMLALGPAHARPAVRDVFDNIHEIRW